MKKQALSPQTTMNLLRARAAQGTHVAPQLMGAMENAVRAGGTVTPAPMRQLALHTAESAQLARKAEQFAAHPVPTARREAAGIVTGLEESHPERMFDLSRPVGIAEMPAPTAEKKNLLFGSTNQLHDPNAVLTSPRPMRTIPPGEQAAADAVTAVGGAAPRNISGTAPTAALPPAEVATRVGRLRKLGMRLEQRAYGQSTNTPGRLRGQIPQDPAITARTAFSGVQRQVDIGMPDTPKLGGWITEKLARRKLDGRTVFRGLKISIETDKGNHRHWYDPHTKTEGKTKMLYPYGYIRRTEGMDGDHVDVFVGPNEQAENVYVVRTKKAPDFTADDEEKCMLGFDSLEAAKAAFLAHYDDPRFVAKITEMPFADFEKKVKATFDGRSKKVAALARKVDSFSSKLAGDPGTPRRNNDLVYWGGHAGGTAPAQLPQVTGVEEKPRGLAPAGESKLIVADPARREDRIDRSFNYMDNDKNTTAIEGAWGSPTSGSSEIP